MSGPRSRFLCGYCPNDDLSFASFLSLSVHASNIHDIVGDITNYKTVVRSGEEEKYCSECKSRFPSRSSLIVHRKDCLDDMEKDNDKEAAAERVVVAPSPLPVLQEFHEKIVKQVAPLPQLPLKAVPPQWPIREEPPGLPMQPFPVSPLAEDQPLAPERKEAGAKRKQEEIVAPLAPPPENVVLVIEPPPPMLVLPPPPPPPAAAVESQSDDAMSESSDAALSVDYSENPPPLEPVVVGQPAKRRRADSLSKPTERIDNLSAQMNGSHSLIATLGVLTGQPYETIEKQCGWLEKRGLETVNNLRKLTPGTAEILFHKLPENILLRDAFCAVYGHWFNDVVPASVVQSVQK